MSEYRPAYQTPRFDVFWHRVTRNPAIGEPREVYEAWAREDDIPRSLCEVTVNGTYIEWMHVCEEHRRQGIATEVIVGLTAHIGRLDITGVTESGEGFCEAIKTLGL